MIDTCGAAYVHDSHLYEYEGTIFKCNGVPGNTQGGLTAKKE